MQQIETFLTIVKYMNLSKAAEAMYISQPALSKTLQRLEERIGVQLFVRGTQGLILTAEGEYLTKAFEPLYNSMNEAINAARTISNKSVRQLRFVHTSIYDISDIFREAKDYLHRFAVGHPDIEISESICEYREIRNAIEFGNADIAMVYDFVLDKMKNISYKRVTEFTLYLAMSREHPFAAMCDKMPSADLLAKEVFYRVGYLDEESSYPIYEDECRQAGFMPKQFVFVSNMQTLFHSIRENKGMSLCTKFDHFGDADEIKYYDIPPLRKKKHTVAAWRTDKLSPEARLFISTLPGDVVRNEE